MSNQTAIKEPTLKRLRQSWERTVMADKDFSTDREMIGAKNVKMNQELVLF